MGSLCEAWRESTRFDAAGHRVNLLFDRETDAIEVESPYTHPALSVRLKRPGPLFVRLPPWLDAGRIDCRGPARPACTTNGYLFFEQPAVNRPIVLEAALPAGELMLKHRTHRYRARLRGDAVTAMDKNFGADLAFFRPSIEAPPGAHKGRGSEPVELEALLIDQARPLRPRMLSTSRKPCFS